MTIAICIRCGQRKIGALSPCASCGYAPREPVDKAKSLMLSDHSLGEAALAEAAARLSQGLAVDFDERALQTIAAGLAGEVKDPLGCRVVVWALMASLISLVALVVWLWFQR